MQVYKINFRAMRNGCNEEKNMLTVSQFTDIHYQQNRRYLSKFHQKWLEHCK